MNLRGKDGLLYIESNFSSISKWLDKSRTKAEVAYVVGLPSNKFEEDIWVWTSKEPNISVDNNRTKAVSSLNISGGGYFLEFNGGFSKGEIKSLVAYIEEFNVKSGRAK